MTSKTLYLGKAGEHAVAAQLLIRGMSPSFHAVDEGADLLVGHLRIQIKSARRLQRTTNSAYVYHFNVGHSAWDSAGKRFYKRTDSRIKADFYVFWGIDENRFWICPTSLISKHSVRIVEDSKRYSVDQSEVKALMGTGLTQRDIARRLGISEMSVSRAVNGNVPKTLPGSCHEVMSREGAWHEIINAAGLVNKVEAAHEKLQEVYS